MSMMKPTRINWMSRIQQLVDVTSNIHIPPDVAFKIEDKDGVHEINVHKMVMAMASQIFNEMFFGGNGEDKSVRYVIAQGTNMTKAAFEIMINGIYNTTPIEDSLNNMSVHEVFAVLEVVNKYQISELQLAVREHLANFPLTDDTLLEVAAEAMQCSILFQELQEDVQALLVLCARFLKPKFKDAQSVFQYVAQNEDRKDVVHKLQVLMKDIASPIGSTMFLGKAPKTNLQQFNFNVANFNEMEQQKARINEQTNKKFKLANKDVKLSLYEETDAKKAFNNFKFGDDGSSSEEEFGYNFS